MGIPFKHRLYKKEAIKQAKKRLAYFLAGVLYDNEDLPSNAPIPSELVTKHMELISLKPMNTDYAEEIEEHLTGRHWHISFNQDWSSDFKAVAYKNKNGLWDVKEDGLFIEIAHERLLQICPTYPLICTVRLQSEAQEAFDCFVRKIQEGEIILQ